MMHFAWPWIFLILPLPWLLRRLLPVRAPGRALRLPHAGLDVPVRRDGWFRSPRSWMLMLAWCLLVCAAARPQWLGPPEPLQRSGRGVMVAVDISGSMREHDMRLGGVRVSRFNAVRAIAGDFIDRREGDQVGLILFGTQAYLVTPLTFDLDAVRAQLQDVAVGLAGQKTAIGDAIAVAVRRLRKLPSSQRVLVLLTDGVNTAGTLSPTAAARIAKAAGVRVYTIGIGASNSLLQSFFGGGMGNPAVSLDTSVLKHIADSTGGAFYRATDTDELAAAYRAIDAQEPTVGGDVLRRPRHALYPWPLGMALLLGLLTLMLNARTQLGRRA